MKTIAAAMTASNLFGMLMRVEIVVNSGNGWAQATVNYSVTRSNGQIGKGRHECDQVFTDNTMDRVTRNALRRSITAFATDAFNSNLEVLQELGTCVFDLLPLISNQLREC